MFNLLQQLLGHIRRLIALSMLLSLLASLAPMISELSAGTRTIILTIVIAGLAAYFFPHKEA